MCVHDFFFFFLCGSVGRSSEEDSRGDMDDTECEPDPTLPCTEDVILKTEQVTKNIQELLRAAQEFKHDRYDGLLPLKLNAKSFCYSL